MKHKQAILVMYPHIYAPIDNGFILVRILIKRFFWGKLKAGIKHCGA